MSRANHRYSFWLLIHLSPRAFARKLRRSSDKENGAPVKRSHTLRYVLRNRATDDTYLVILFTLYRREDVNEDGLLKPAALEGSRQHDAAAAAAQEEKLEAGGQGGQDYDEARRRFGNLDIADDKGEKSKDGDDDVD